MAKAASMDRAMADQIVERMNAIQTRLDQIVEEIDALEEATEALKGVERYHDVIDRMERDLLQLEQDEHRHRGAILGYLDSLFTFGFDVKHNTWTDHLYYIAGDAE